MKTYIRLTCCLLPLVCVTIARAGDSTPASKPAAEAVALRYEVNAVEGNVRVGPENDDSLNTNGPGWFTPKVGDLLGAGIQIRVPIRANIKLIARPADPPTVMLIDRGSTVAISELAFKDGAAKSRIKLGYGAIRAGVAEGGTRSDMEIEAPTATLSKKGTDIFEFQYNDGRFTMSLTEQGRGMLQAIQNQGGYAGGQLSRFVTAGQFVTQQLVKVIDNVHFDRTINVNDQFGLTGADQFFTLMNNHGLGFLLQPGNNPINQLNNNNNVQPQGNNNNTITNTTTNNVIASVVRSTPTAPGGDFGIGQGSLAGLNDATQRLNTQRQMTTVNSNTLLKQVVGARTR